MLMINYEVFFLILKPIFFFFLIICAWIGYSILSNYSKYKNSHYRTASGNRFFKTIFNKGNYGEFLTFRSLEKLEGDNKILSNIYVPKEDGTTTEIDLLMINRKGIYVFESKNYSGWIFGDEKSKNWTQSFKGGKKIAFMNPIWQNKAHINALIKLMNLSENDPIYSYIIFSEQCELKKISFSLQNVNILKRNQLLSLIKKDISTKEDQLKEEQVVSIYENLKNYTLVDDKVKQLHIQGIKEKLKLEVR